MQTKTKLIPEAAYPYKGNKKECDNTIISKTSNGIKVKNFSCKWLNYYIMYVILM